MNAAHVQRESQSSLVPALDQNAPYRSRLSARSALYTDLRLLLDERKHALSTQDYRSLVVEENCLVRGSDSARRKLWRELHARYILDAADPLFTAFWTEWRRSGSETERSLTAYVYLALNDRLVADLGTEWLFPLLRRAPAELRVNDVRAFIKRSAHSHPEVTAWSENTIHRVSQHYCASIRDFGLAKGKMRKTTIRPALYGSPVRLLVRALRLIETPLLDLVRSPIFRLLAIDKTEVVDTFGELNRLGALRFRMQGDVVELHLPEVS